MTIHHDELKKIVDAVLAKAAKEAQAAHAEPAIAAAVVED